MECLEFEDEIAVQLMVNRKGGTLAGICKKYQMNLLGKQGRKQVANFGGAWKDENSNFK